MAKRKLETHKTLDKAERVRARLEWAPPKWIQFARYFLKAGYKVESSYIKSTRFNYLFITKHNHTVKVRFANSKSSKLQEKLKDYDYCVDVNFIGVKIMSDLVPLIEAEFSRELP